MLFSINDSLCLDFHKKINPGLIGSIHRILQDKLSLIQIFLEQMINPRLISTTSVFRIDFQTSYWISNFYITSKIEIDFQKLYWNPNFHSINRFPKIISRIQFPYHFQINLGLINFHARFGLHFQKWIRISNFHSRNLICVLVSKSISAESFSENYNQISISIQNLFIRICVWKVYY